MYEIDHHSIYSLDGLGTRPRAVQGDLLRVKGLSAVYSEVLTRLEGRAGLDAAAVLDLDLGLAGREEGVVYVALIVHGLSSQLGAYS